MTPEYRIEVENRIKEYFAAYDDIDEIINIKCEETFNDLGTEVNVWNVKTKSQAYWVVEGDSAPMNLYTQNGHYFSADEAYSFHMGITQRLGKKYQDEFKHVLEEVPLDIEEIKSINRKLNLVSEKLGFDLEPEEFQSIGLICREALIDLAKEFCRRNPELIKEKKLKSSDFKGIAKEFILLYIPGKNNSDLRNYSRKIIESAWDYNSILVHSQKKTFPDAKIALLFTSAAVSLFQNLFLKYIGFDHELGCRECGSKKIEIFETEDEETILHCLLCGTEEKLE